MTEFRFGRPLRLSATGSATVSGSFTAGSSTPAANAFTLSGPTGGTTGSPSTFTVTPNGQMAATVVVTPAATNAGSLVPLTLTFSIGSSAAQSFSVTRASDGTSVVSITNNGGLTNSGTPISFSTVAAGVGNLSASFNLTSAVGGTLMPFTIGHPFKRGDVPSGQFITTASIAAFQAEVRNRWADGSVKFAVLSGRATLSAGVASSVVLTTTASAPGGANIAESVLITANPACSVALGAFGTVTLAALFGSPVRSILGPVMSEFHYRSAVGADPHLSVWFFVRLYVGGQIEIEIVVENGYMKVASPGNKSYTATITINGTVRYTAALVHWPNTRWGTINWYDGTSGLTDFARVTPSHSTTYFLSTKVVPNYSTAAVPTGAYLNTLPQSIVPLGNGSFPAGGLAGAGALDYIGILPRWDAAYILSGDARAFRASVVNSYSSNSWPVVWRDEVTQRPLALASRPNIDAAGWGPDSVVFPVTNSNGNSFGSGAQAHLPSCGFAGYLITGRWSHLETAAFWAARSHMENNPTSRGLTTNNGGSATAATSGEDRGKGWNIRSAAQAAAAYPDTCPTAADQAVRDDWITAVGGTFTKWQSTSLNDPKGYISTMYSPGVYDFYIPTPDLGVGAFQMYFVTQCVGYAYDLDVLSGAQKTSHQAVRDHFYKFPIGMLGDASGWSYRQGPRFVAAVGTRSGSTVTWDATWAAAYARHRASAGSAGGAEGVTDFSNGLSIVSGNWPDATSYGGNMMPAIAYAVEHGVAGASAAYARLTGASNYSAFVSSQPSAQQWAVLPRSDPAQLPSWYPASAGQVVQIPGTSTIGISTRAAGANTYPGSDPDDIAKPWCGGAMVTLSQQAYLLAYGGGHGDSSYNGIHKFGPLNGSGSDTPTWSLHLAGSNPAIIPPSNSTTHIRTYSDGRQPAQHTYNALVGVDDKLYASSTGSYPLDTDDGFYSFTSAGQTTLASEICTSNFHASAHYNGKIYAIGGSSQFDKLRIYTIATNTWASEAAVEIALGNYMAMAIDTLRGAILINSDFCSPPNASGTGAYWPSVATLTGRRVGISKAPGFTTAAFSLEYDADRDVFVSFVQNSLTLYECSAATLAAGGDAVWVARTFTGTVPVASTPNGTFGRFRYVPQLKGYIVTPNIESPSYFFRST